MSLSQVNGCLSCQHEVSLERLLPHLCGTVVDAAELAGGWLCIWARARAEATVCPRCGQSSARVHSAYQRRLADTPVGGHRVVIRLTVRRFFCANPDCPAVTFAEQIDGLTSRRARRTPPLARALAGIALALAGRAGARLAALLGLVASRSGLLRLIMALPVPAPGPVRVLGVDLSRLCDYRDCWRAAAADAVVAGVREAARGGPGRDNSACLMGGSGSLALPERGASGRRQHGHGFVGLGRGPAGRVCGWLSA